MAEEVTMGQSIASVTIRQVRVELQVSDWADCWVFTLLDRKRPRVFPSEGFPGVLMDQDVLTIWVTKTSTVLTIPRSETLSPEEKFSAKKARSRAKMQRAVGEILAS